MVRVFYPQIFCFARRMGGTSVCSSAGKQTLAPPGSARRIIGWRATRPCEPPSRVARGGKWCRTRATARPFVTHLQIPGDKFGAQGMRVSAATPLFGVRAFKRGRSPFTRRRRERRRTGSACPSRLSATRTAAASKSQSCLSQGGAGTSASDCAHAN